MPFIEQAVSDAVEDELVPEGEYELRIVAHETKENKAGTGELIQVQIEITDPPEGIKSPAPIFHYLSLVGPNDEPKSKSFKLRMQRRFLECFSIPFEGNGFNDDDFDGATGRCLVTQQEITPSGCPSSAMSGMTRQRLRSLRGVVVAGSMAPLSRDRAKPWVMTVHRRGSTSPKPPRPCFENG
jgi:hypothetical protein